MHDLLKNGRIILMIWKLTRPLSVFLLVTLAIGCNGSAKQVAIEGHVSDADMIAAAHNHRLYR